MGAIDLDPASSQEANVIVNAAHYFDAEIDGLACEWSGRVWMNPPYSGDVMGRFCAKLRSSFESGQVTEAIVLVNNATETRWFQDLCARASALCFPSGRIRYWKPNKETNTPLQGQTFVYLGENAHQFIDEFKHFGMVCNVIR